MSTVIQDESAPPLEARSGLPRSFRWMLAFPGSPVWLAAGLGLLYFLGSTAAMGIDDTRGGLWDPILYALYFAWIPLALVVLVRGTGRDAGDLAPTLNLDAATLRTRVFAAGSRALPWSVPVALGVAGVDMMAMAGEGLLDAAPAVAAFFAVREVVVCIGIFGVLGWAAGAARSLSRLTRAHARPNLLDPRPLAPLARCGTRMLLFWVLMLSLSLPILFVDTGISAETLHFLGAVSVVLLVVAVATMVIPTWGARQAIRIAKAAELDRVRGQIEAAREARDDGRLPGLLAWEARIRSTPEWPIDAGSLRLAGLYVLIPVLSWVGGALVERVVDGLVG